MKGFYKGTNSHIYYNDGDQFKGITFFNNKYELNDSLNYFFFQDTIAICDLPLPNKNSFKKQYRLNEFVYYTKSYITLEGKVIGFKDKIYEVESCCISLSRFFRANHEMVPYNWHIMHDRCKSAIFTWLLVCKRFPKIYKDIRVLICNYIWETRHEFSGEV